MKNLNYLMDLILHAIFRAISNKPTRSMKHIEIYHQSKCISIKFRIELQSKSKPGTILNFDTKNYESTWKY